jgi:hypothetical protein
METKKEFAPSNVAWEKMDKNNNVYLSIKLKNGEWINLFRNTKRSAKSPHWVEISKEEKKDDLQFGDFGPEPTFDDKSEIPF